MNKIKVLVVDDSRLFREMISRSLNSSPDIQVVAAAGELFWSRVFLCLVVLSTAETKQIYKPDWACECDST